VAEVADCCRVRKGEVFVEFSRKTAQKVTSFAELVKTSVPASWIAKRVNRVANWKPADFGVYRF
jgi:hypothetical protein